MENSYECQVLAILSISVNCMCEMLLTGGVGWCGHACSRGGTLITFTGKNMDVAQHPTLIVSVIVQRLVRVNHFTISVIRGESVCATCIQHALLLSRLSIALRIYSISFLQIFDVVSVESHESTQGH